MCFANKIFSLIVGLLFICSSQSIKEECSDVLSSSSLLRPATTLELSKTFLGDSDIPYKYKQLNDSSSSQKVQKILSHLVSGEFWESTESNVFRYWEPKRLLASITKLNYTSGWRQVVAQSRKHLRELIEANRKVCPSLKGRYYMVTPIVKDEDFELPNELIKIYNQDITLFGGCGGTSTALHYDSSDNMFLQLQGTKRFVLFPLDTLSDLYFAPAAHPYHRHSLIQPSDLNENITFWRTPRSKNVIGKAIIADLKPGELLFIPKFWSHWVMSTSHDTLGIAIRKKFKSPVQYALFDLPLPFESNWELHVTFPTLRRFIHEILRNDSDLLERYRERWTFSFENYMNATNNQPTSEVKLDISEDKAVVMDEEKLMKYAERALTVLSGEESPYIREVMTFEYCDDTIMTVLNTTTVLSFALDYFS